MKILLKQAVFVVALLAVPNVLSAGGTAPTPEEILGRFAITGGSKFRVLLDSEYLKPSRNLTYSTANLSAVIGNPPFSDKRKLRNVYDALAQISPVLTQLSPLATQDNITMLRTYAATPACTQANKDLLASYEQLFIHCLLVVDAAIQQFTTEINGLATTGSSPSASENRENIEGKATFLENRGGKPGYAEMLKQTLDAIVTFLGPWMNDSLRTKAGAAYTSYTNATAQNPNRGVALKNLITQKCQPVS